MAVAAALMLIGKGVLLGLGAAAPIGPVNVEIARRTLRQGFRFGLAIGGGAVTVDVTYAIIASFGWAPLIGRAWVTYALGIAGGLLLLYLAAMCFKGVMQAARGRDRFVEGDDSATSGPGLRATFVTGLLMTLLNPMTLAFWFVVLPAMATKLTENPRKDLPLLCAGVFIGAFGWCVSFSGILAVLGRFRRDLWAIIADAVGGVVLLGFAVVTAVRMIQR